MELNLFNLIDNNFVLNNLDFDKSYEKFDKAEVFNKVNQIEENSYDLINKHKKNLLIFIKNEMDQTKCEDFFYSIIYLIYFRQYEFIENILNKEAKNTNIKKKQLIIIKLFYLFFTNQIDFFLEELEINSNIENDMVFGFFIVFLKILYYLKFDIDFKFYIKNIIKLPGFVLINKNLLIKLNSILFEYKAFGTIYYLYKKSGLNLLNEDIFIFIKTVNGFYKKDDLFVLKNKFKEFNKDFDLMSKNKNVVKMSFFKKLENFYSLNFPYLKYYYFKKSIFVVDKKEFNKAIFKSIIDDPGYKYFYSLLMFFYAINKEKEKLYKIEEVFNKYFVHDKETVKFAIKAFFKIQNYEKTKLYIDLFGKSLKDNEIERINSVIKKLTKI